MDDDLGFQPKQQADDDLGFQPKVAPESWGHAILNAIPGMSPAVDALAMNPSTIPQAAGNLVKSIPNAAGQVVSGGMQGVGIPDFITSPLQNVPTPSPEASNAMALAANIALAAPGIEALPDIANLASSGGKALLGKLSNITGFNADTKATEFIKNLVGDQPTIKEGFNQDYTDIDNLADKKGYNLKPNSTQKPIDSTTFNGGFNTMSPNDRGAVLNNLSADAKKSLDQFTNKPSYENAHDLQSILGNEGISLRKSADGRDRYVGGQILGLRNNLNSDINNTFDKFGDMDLSNARKDVTQRYADNENRLLLANKLRGGIKELPNGGLDANAQQIVNAFGKLAFKNSISKFPSPQTAQFEPGIAALQSALSKRDITTKLAKRIGKPLMWGGLAGLGLEGIHRYL